MLRSARQHGWMDAPVPSPSGHTPKRNRPGPKRKEGEPAGPDEVRSAVLMAAAELFGDQGVEPTSLRQIAVRANVHPGLIVRYIGRREQLIEAVYLDLTDRLVADIHRRPLHPHSFERKSTMGRWTVMVTHFALRRAPPPAAAANPVTALADAIVTHYGADADTARWRAAQIVGSALGWRLFELQLMQMGGLDVGVLPDIREDLNLLHNIAGSLPLPTGDPRPPDQR